ncbi:hypothetical protein CC78DRAFT_605294 [Lojkania enalia]|uniref:BRCT domain-containing protein n=1 Tax=Lojkania enalia TaxID=147567 RepID=A0A9P4K893_9PLEO|nr:hypothetical protein CC78DRAFT_605294 [Didymosphaeria enalia]
MGVLKSLTITAAGDLGSGKSNDQLKKWIDANDGKWVPKVQKGITHLVCSKEAWKKKTSAVKQAARLGARIVSYDWLEDSLMARRKVTEKKYLWKNLSENRRKRKAIKRTSKIFDSKTFNEGVMQAKEDTGSGRFRKPSSSRKSKSASFRRRSISVERSPPPVRASSKGGFFQSSLAQLKAIRKKREVGAKAKHGEEEEVKIAGEERETEIKALEDSQGLKVSSSMPTLPYSQVTTPSISEHIPSPSISERTPTPPPTLSSSEPRPQSEPAISPKPSTPPSSATQTSPSQAISTTDIPKTKRLTDLYHVFNDATGFSYNITLVRANLFNFTSTRYNLRLFESNTKPHVYCTFARYTPPPSPSPTSELTLLPGLKEDRPSISKDSTTSSTSSDSNSHATNSTHPNLLAALHTITSPTPSQNTPYRTLLIPQNSDYRTAFTAFRHAFQDLTHLSWEERLLPSARDLQKARAKMLNIEPFVYVRPPSGAPLGIPPPDIPLYVSDDTYIRGALQLPGMHVPLSNEGSIGCSVLRDEEAVQHREEQKIKSEKNGEKVSVAARNRVGKKKSDYRQRPLFRSHDPDTADKNSGKYVGWRAVKREVRPFPAQR